MANVMDYNVVVLGFAFMFVFTAFQSGSGIEETVIESINVERNSTALEGSGYYSLSIIYAVFAFSNWLAPSVVSVCGPRVTMLLSAIVYTGFIAIFLKLAVWSLYLMSVLLGVAAACIWTAQGNFLTINSTSDTMGRNSGIFWAMLQSSLLFGNLFIFFEIGKDPDDSDHINESTRTTIYIVLTSVSGLGVLIFLLLRRPPPRDESTIQSSDQSPDVEVKLGPWQALVRSVQLLKLRSMQLLMVCFFYTGLELTFFSGVYGTCVGNTHQLGSQSKSYVALCGILIGCGEIIGGATFGLFGSRTNKYGRDPIVLLGFVLHIVAFYLALLNLPSASPITDVVLGEGYIQPSLPTSLVTAFLLGLGDSCFNTQIYSILGHIFVNDSAPAFALFKFVQSLAAAIAFFYAKHLLLQWQLLILVVFSVLGTLSFATVEWTANQKMREGYQQI